MLPMTSKHQYRFRFSALQRAEIAEIGQADMFCRTVIGFSALQRAEIAEMLREILKRYAPSGFSALQRAEIAEIELLCGTYRSVSTFQCSSTSRNC